MSKYLFLFLVIGLFSCSKKQPPDFYTIKTEKDFIPEGIAFSQDKIFLSSITKNKIVVYDTESDELSDFITSNQYGFGSGIGLFATDSLLFALSNSNIKPNEFSKPSLFVFRLEDKKLVRKYILDDKQNHFWNDLTVSDLGQVYITDMRQNKVYTIKYPLADIQEFYGDSTTTLPNGIDLSADGSKLFIASTKTGVRILDLKTRKVLNKINTFSNGIDGLKFHEGNLYGMRNIDKPQELHSFLKIKLSKNQDEIEQVDMQTVIRDRWNVPTTMAITKNEILLLVNSQMENLDQTNMFINEPDKLTDTFVERIKIRQ
jgi:WD40 repeat protein